MFTVWRTEHRSFGPHAYLTETALGSLAREERYCPLVLLYAEWGQDLTFHAHCAKFMCLSWIGLSCRSNCARGDCRRRPALSRWQCSNIEISDITVIRPASRAKYAELSWLTHSLTHSFTTSALLCVLFSRCRRMQWPTHKWDELLTELLSCIEHV